MWRSIGLVLAGLVLVGVAFIAPFPLTYDVPPEAVIPDSSWRVVSFEADYDVQEDASILVEERIAVDFGGTPTHGIFRDRVVRQKCGSGTDSTAVCPAGRYRLYPIRGFEAYDSAGTKLPVKIEGNGDLRRYKIGDADRFAANNERYRLVYRLENAVNPLPGSDELYWNVTGEWPVVIGMVRVTVTLPGTAIVEGECFEGSSSRTRNCTASVSGSVATFTSSNRGVSFGEQLTVAARFPNGTLAIPPSQTKDVKTAGDFYTLSPLRLAIAGALVLLSAGLAYAAWWRIGRDRQYTSLFYLTQDPTEETLPILADRKIVVEFLPPDDLRPAEMALILNERTSPRDVSTTVVDLAVRGYITIAEVPKKGRANDWTFTRVKADDDTLRPFEKRLLAGMFSGAKTEVKLSALKNKFAADVQTVQNMLLTSAMKRRWFAFKPGRAATTWVALGFVSVLAGCLLAIGLGYGLGEFLLGIPVALGGLVLLAAAPHMPRRTASGSEVLRRTLGFRLYVATAETRMQEFNEQQNIFARYLPYAMAFDCVDKWAKAFKGLANQPDVAGVSSWYLGASAFNAASFSRGMNSFSSAVSHTFVSTPGGSGGSSGGGGGFSGGGGGGGGGGRW